jgi:hypothetical protein
MREAVDDTDAPEGTDADVTSYSLLRTLNYLRNNPVGI